MDRERRLGDDYYRAVGRIAIEFSVLEFYIKVWVTVLLGAGPDAGMLASAFIDFRNLSAMLDALYNRKFWNDQARLEKFAGILSRVDKVAQERNLVIHSAWFSSESGRHALGIKYPRGRVRWFEPSISEKTPSEMNSVAEEIINLAHEIGDQIVDTSESKPGAE